MKPKDVEVGKIYVNRGKGTTSRKVLAIGDEHRPKRFYSDRAAPDEPGVLYQDIKGRQDNLYLSSFASWAWGVVG